MERLLNNALQSINQTQGTIWNIRNYSKINFSPQLTPVTIPPRDRTVQGLSHPNPPSPPYNWQAEANREHKDCYWLSKLCFAWPYWELYNKFNKEAMMWIKTHTSLQLRSSECNPGLLLNVMYSSAQRTQKILSYLVVLCKRPCLLKHESLKKI